MVTAVSQAGFANLGFKQQIIVTGVNHAVNTQLEPDDGNYI